MSLIVFNSILNRESSDSYIEKKTSSTCNDDLILNKSEKILKVDFIDKEFINLFQENKKINKTLSLLKESYFDLKNEFERQKETLKDKENALDSLKKDYIADLVDYDKIIENYKLNIKRKDEEIKALQALASELVCQNKTFNK